MMPVRFSGTVLMYGVQHLGGKVKQQAGPQSTPYSLDALNAERVLEHKPLTTNWKVVGFADTEQGKADQNRLVTWLQSMSIAHRSLAGAMLSTTQAAEEAKKLRPDLMKEHGQSTQERYKALRAMCSRPPESPAAT